MFHRLDSRRQSDGCEALRRRPEMEVSGIAESRPPPGSCSSMIPDMPNPFPFSAIVGQEDMKLSFLIAAVDPSVGGVLVFGDRGTGKSTAVRALAALLPEMRAVAGCPYHCEPSSPAGLCAACGPGAARAPKSVSRPVPVV